MRLTNLDTITKGLLISRAYPIHFYMQFLFFGSRAYEELSFDSLHNIKTVKLSVIPEYNAVDLPCDVMDIVKVGVENGQFIRPLNSRDGINSLNNFNTDGSKTMYGNTTINFGISNAFNFQGYQSFYPNEQFKGRLFGMGSANNPNSFKFIPERNQIQLYEGLTADHIILEYISDGTEIDNATMITPYAKGAIEAYILWKMKEGSRAYGEGERERYKQQWIQQHLLFRARKFHLTKEDILATMRKHTHGAIKG